MGLLDWFRQSTPKLDEARVSPQQVEEAIDYLVKMTDARLTLVHHYRERLAGPVARTLEYLASLREQLPSTHEAGPLSWSQDHSLRAFFGHSSDLLNTFAHCQKLKDYAAKASALDPIYALLAMEFSERKSFGVGLQGQMMVRDVAQTTLSFSQHRLRLFARNEIELGRAISRRLLDELAMIALEHMHQEQDQRRELEEHHQLLHARIATFAQRGAGADSFLGEAGAHISDEESHALLQKLAENETSLAALGSPSEALDRQLDHLALVLAEPMKFIQIEHRRVCVDSMNVLVPAGRGEEIEFGVASFDRHPPQRRAFLPVRVDRSLIGEGRTLRLDKAERWL